jgi:hypothetical protein
MIDCQSESLKTSKISKLSHRDRVRSRIEARESSADIREALQSPSASSYVFAVQGYFWEVQS